MSLFIQKRLDSLSLKTFMIISSLRICRRNIFRSTKFSKRKLQLNNFFHNMPLLPMSSFFHICFEYYLHSHLVLFFLSSIDGSPEACYVIDLSGSLAFCICTVIHMNCSHCFSASSYFSIPFPTRHYLAKQLIPTLTPCQGNS